MDLNNGKPVKLPNNYSENNWHPQIFLLNISPDHKEKLKYSMKKISSQIEIREYHDIHGDFYSKFDLYHFPNDIQELNVSIGSALFDTEVILQADTNRPSGINREAFIDQQEWKLYNHVETKTKFLRGFLFQNDDDDDEVDIPGHEKKRSMLTISCHAGKLFLMKNLLFSYFHSSSFIIFLLEWLLSYIFNNINKFYCFCYST